MRHHTIMTRVKLLEEQSIVKPDPKEIENLKHRIEKLEEIIESMGYYISKR